MKIYYFLLFGFILLFIRCNQNSRLPEFSFNDSTYLKCNLKKCRNPRTLTISYVSLCPLEENDLNIMCTKDTTILIKLLVNHAVTINLVSPGINATCFNLPKDTLEIFIDFSLKQKDKGKITFRGKCAAISSYLTYYKYNISSSPRPSQSVIGYTSQVDNLIRKGISELHKFDSKTPLPDWFVKMEELDIKYSGSRDKVYQFKLRNRYNFRDRLIPKDYLKQLDARLNNPKAKYSLSYYGFLNNYSTLYLYSYLGQKNIGPNETYLYILENIRSAQKYLHSDLKELYTAQRICALLSKGIVRQAQNTNDSLYFHRVDSLINSARSYFNNDEILNALLDFQKRQLSLASKYTNN